MRSSRQGLSSTPLRIVLDTTILVPAEKSQGPARQLLLMIVSGPHTLVLCNETHYKPRSFDTRECERCTVTGGQDLRLHRFPLSEVSELVTLNPILSVPVRVVNDIVVDHRCRCLQGRSPW